MEPTNQPWAAYSPPPPTTPPDLDEFGHPNSPIPEGRAIGFECNVALDVVPDSKEEDVPPLLENLDPIPNVVCCRVFWVRPGEIDFIPFEVCGQCCK